MPAIDKVGAAAYGLQQGGYRWRMICKVGIYAGSEQTAGSEFACCGAKRDNHSGKRDRDKPSTNISRGEHAGYQRSHQCFCSNGGDFFYRCGDDLKPLELWMQRKAVGVPCRPDDLR